MEELKKKFRKRLWLLRNLKNARAERKDLIDCYVCFIRPVLEYCSNVYHPMLCLGLTKMIEKMQFTALKIILGYGKEKEKLLEESGLPTLEERRKRLFNKFCMKVYENERFREEWLEERTFTGHDLRKQKIIREKNSRTKRLFDSPLYTIRRYLNDFLVK